MDRTLDDCKMLLVRRWGEMGGYWGINRTTAEIHALLFLSSQPLCTDDIMRQLHISRGNASMNLRGLVDWGLIRRVHKLGDRKEYFQGDGDAWHMFETIMRERRRREVEPIIDSIERCRNMIPKPGRSPQGPSAEEVREFTCRLDELQGFLTAMGMLFELVLRFGRAGVDTLMQLASTVAPEMPEDGAAPPATKRAAGRTPRPRSRSAKTRARKPKP